MNMDGSKKIVLAIVRQHSVAGVLQHFVEQIADCPESGFSRKTEAFADRRDQ